MQVMPVKDKKNLTDECAVTTLKTPSYSNLVPRETYLLPLPTVPRNTSSRKIICYPPKALSEVILDLAFSSSQLL